MDRSRSGRWRAAIAVLLLGVLPPGHARAGPWTKSAGELYLKLNEGFFISDKFVDASGMTRSGTDYFGATTSLYLELGIGRGLHLQAYLPHTVASNSFDDGARFVNAGGGDALLALQYSPPLSLPLRHALRLEVKLPFYDVGQVAGLRAASNFPALGDGQVDLTWWLSVGGAPLPALYLFGELGYRHRTEAFIGDGPAAPRSYGDGIALYAQVGYTVLERLIVAANLGGILSFDADDGLTKSYLTLGPSLYLPLWRGVALEAGFDPVIYAKNSASGFGLGLGLSYKR